LNAEDDELQFKRADPFLAQAFEAVGYQFSKAIEQRPFMLTLRSEIRNAEMKIFSQWPTNAALLYSTQPPDRQTLKIKNSRLLKRMAVRIQHVSSELQDALLKCAVAVEERIVPIQMDEDIPALDLGPDMLADILQAMNVK
jgi:hypothetical protein